MGHRPPPQIASLAVKVDPSKDATDVETYAPPPDPAIALLPLKTVACCTAIVESPTAIAPCETDEHFTRQAAKGGLGRFDVYHMRYLAVSASVWPAKRDVCWRGGYLPDTRIEYRKGTWIVRHWHRGCRNIIFRMHVARLLVPCLLAEDPLQASRLKRTTPEISRVVGP